MADILGLIVSIKDVSSLVYRISKLPALSKENRSLAHQLRQKLRTINDSLRSVPVLRDPSSLSKTLLYDVEQDFRELKVSVGGALGTQRTPSFTGYIHAEEYQIQLKDALNAANQFQQRLESHVLFSELRNDFITRYETLHSTIRNAVSQPHSSGDNNMLSSNVCTDNVQNANTVASDAENGELEKVRFIKELSKTLNEVTSALIPGSRRNSIVEGQACSEAASLAGDGDLSLANDVYNDELVPTNLFCQIPSTVRRLIEEAIQSGLPRKEVVRQLNHALNQWMSWRIPADRIIYEHTRSGCPKQLGRGAMGEVHAAKLLPNKTLHQEVKPFLPVAVKRVEVAESNYEAEMVDLLREVLIQMSLDHPSILKTYGVCWDAPFGMNMDNDESKDFDDSRNHDLDAEHENSDENGNNAVSSNEVRIVMERMTHNLEQAINKGLLQSQDKIFVLIDVASALLHLHFNGIVHRDVKPGNILVQYKDNQQVGMTKLADFGCSRRSYITRTNRTLNFETRTRQGTMIFMPPEVLVDYKKCPSSPSWDVWAYGLLICHVMAPPNPMSVDVWHASEWASTGRLGSAARNWASSIEDERLKSLARRCLQEDPATRPSMLQVYLFQIGVLDESALTKSHVPADILDEHAEQLKQGARSRQDHNEADMFFSYARSNQKQEERPSTKSHRKEISNRENLLTNVAPQPGTSQSTSGESSVVSVDIPSCASSRSSIPGDASASQSSLVASLSEIWLPPLSDFESELNRSISEGRDENDPKVRFQRWRERGINGDTESVRFVGECYYKGYGVDSKNFSKAEKAFMHAIQRGDLLAKVRLGDMYRDGKVSGRGNKDAFQLYSEASEAGNARAKLRMGECYKTGLGVSRVDFKKTLKYFEDAANLGDPVGKLRLGMLYERGDCKVPKDKEKAFGLFEEACNLGSGEAALKVGEFYERGLVVKQDQEKAIWYFRRAGEKGVAMSWHKLSDHHTKSGERRNPTSQRNMYIKVHFPSRSLNNDLIPLPGPRRNPFSQFVQRKKS